MTPAVSVVVPTYDRHARAVACVEALARLDPPAGGFEVIVVDDGSPRPVAPALAPLQDRLDLTVARQGNAGPAAARNLGARLARGRLLVFTDDDCRPRRDWLRVFASAAAGQDRTLLGGRTVDRAGGRFARASQLLLDHLYDWYGEDRDGAFFASNNLAAPRRAFLDLGGFDHGFAGAGGEDRELADRWVAAGGALRLVPEAVVDHHHAMGLREFWRQHRAYGFGAYRYHVKRAARLGHGLRPNGPGFYLRLLARPYAVGEPRPTRAAALLVVAQVANVLGYLTAARRARRRRTGTLPERSDARAA